jgi:hypothetical protein
MGGALMKTVSIIFCSLILGVSARADIVLVLNDQERAALISGLAAGLQAQPQLSPSAVYLLNKINTAPTMTSQQVIKPDDPARETPSKKDDMP